MWEETLIESKGFGRSAKRFWTIPAAAALHFALILFAVFASYWHVEAVEAPPARFTYLNAIPVVISPPNLGGGSSQQKQMSKKNPPVRMTQPVEVPPLVTRSTFSIEQLGPENKPGSNAAPPGEGNPGGVPGGIGSTPANTGTGIPAEEPPRVIITGVTPPVLLKRVEPEYPRAAIATRSEGIIILEAVITKNGTVEQVKTLRSDNALLERAAIDAVLQWKYKPAMIQGRPVKVYFTVTVTFHVR